MEIFAFAKTMEKKNAQLYRSLAREASIEGIRAVFTLLAEEEEHHFEIFDAMDNDRAPGMEAGTATAIRKALTVFASLANEVKISADMSDCETAYRQALELEEESIVYYQKTRDTLHDPVQKKRVTQVLDQERAHAALMKAFVEFVKRPAVWLENAEWHHLDAY